MAAKREALVRLLNQLITRRGIKPSQLALYLGVSHVAVGNWLKGEDIPSPESCRKLARYLRVSEEELLEMAGHLSSKRVREAPVPYTAWLERMAAQMPVPIPVVDQIVHAGEGGVPMEYIFLAPEQARGKRLVAAYARGDCMYPTIQEGDLIVVDLEASPNVQDVVVVVVDREDVQVKRLVGKKNGKVILGCENPAYPQSELENVHVVGVVLQVTKKL